MVLTSGGLCVSLFMGFSTWARLSYIAVSRLVRLLTQLLQVSKLSVAAKQSENQSCFILQGLSLLSSLEQSHEPTQFRSWHLQSGSDRNSTQEEHRVSKLGASLGHL